MMASESYRAEIVRKLLSGANVHEVLGIAAAGKDEEVSAYHLELANVMRAAAEIVRGEQSARP